MVGNMNTIKTENFAIYFDSDKNIVCARCLKTGKFVKNAVAKLELPKVDLDLNPLECMIALAFCILSILNVVLCVTGFTDYSEIYTANIIAICAMTAMYKIAQTSN